MKASKSIFRIQSSPLNHNPTSQLSHNNTTKIKGKPVEIMSCQEHNAEN